MSFCAVTLLSLVESMLWVSYLPRFHLALCGAICLGITVWLVQLWFQSLATLFLLRQMFLSCQLNTSATFPWQTCLRLTFTVWRLEILDFCFYLEWNKVCTLLTIIVVIWYRSSTPINHRITELWNNKQISPEMPISSIKSIKASSLFPRDNFTNMGGFGIRCGIRRETTATIRCQGIRYISWHRSIRIVMVAHFIEP